MSMLAGPEDFARLLVSQKREHDARPTTAPVRRHVPDPWDMHMSEESLTRLVQLAWLASFRTDETRRVEARIFVSRFPVQFGPHSFSIDRPLELTSESMLAKLASVAPVSDCAIDVVEEGGKLFVSGVSRDIAPSGAAARTLLQNVRVGRQGWELLILGPGHLRATTPSLTRYVDLSNGAISWPVELADVPPVHDWARRISDAVTSTCSDGLSPDGTAGLQGSSWRLVAGLLTAAVRAIAAARHGGTLLLCDDVGEGLLLGGAWSSKSWPLADPLTRFAKASVLEVERTPPATMDVKVLGAWIDASDQLTAWSEMCAQLAQADGCVLLDGGGRVKAFGVEIAGGTGAASDLRVKDASSGADLDMSAFGTRHRSAARFCSAAERAIGIVVSQDGGIRVFGRDASPDLKLWKSVEASFRH
jgi:hypothetical protein